MNPETDFSQSMDAQQWAKAFKEIVLDKGLEIDEGLLIAWFANAIMRGYDDGRAQLRKANAQVVGGALFDLMGSLTSGETRYQFSAYDDASPAVEALREFAAKRNLDLNEADVQHWNEGLF